MKTNEKSESDAPCWYSAEQASAWASGYNAAMEASRTVFVCIHEHQHGRDVAVFNTQDGADAYKDNLARQWWDAEIGDRMAMPDESPGEAYFDWMMSHGRDEFFGIAVLEMQS